MPLPRRLVFVTTSPLPYQTPVFNELASHTQLHVIYMSAHERMNKFADAWGADPRFDWSVHRSVLLRSHRRDFRAQVSFGVSRTLARLDPDVVGLLSWHPIGLEPLAWARTHDRAVMMWAESTSASGMRRGALSNSIRRSILRRVDAFVSNGSQATGYLKELEVKPEKIVTSRLASRHAGLAHTPSVEGAPRFVYVGRLIPRKRPLATIEAFQSVLQAMPDASLTIVGDGPLLREVQSRAQAVGHSIRVTGHCEGDALDEVFSQTDILLMPALREVWGLVVNEALAHGLWVIATHEVGAAVDLVDGDNGCVLHDIGTPALATAMLSAARHADLSSHGRAQRACTVADVTFSRFAMDMLRASDLAAANRQPRPQS